MMEKGPSQVGNLLLIRKFFSLIYKYFFHHHRSRFTFEAAFFTSLFRTTISNFLFRRSYLQLGYYPNIIVVLNKKFEMVVRQIEEYIK